MLKLGIRELTIAAATPAVEEVAEVEAKLQFKALTKQLQSRGIMVCESIDQAVEYLNQVYDEVSGKAE